MMQKVTTNICPESKNNNKTNDSDLIIKNYSSTNMHQLNMQKNILATSELNIKNDNYKNSILLIQEPRIKKGVVTGLDNFQVASPRHKRPRSIIVAPKNFHLWFDQKHSNQDVCTAVWTVDSEVCNKIILC